MWVPIMYALTFAASFIAMIMFLIRNKKADSQFVAIGILVCVNSLGKLTISLSQTLEMAIWATRFMNVGNVFCPVMLIFIIQNLCGKKMPWYLKYPFLLFAVIILIASVSIGQVDWYYAANAINRDEGYTYIVSEPGGTSKTYGWAYWFYPILMLICFAFLVYYIIYAIKHKKTISSIAILCICSVPTLVIITYAIEIIIGTHVSFVSIGYLIGSFVVQWLFTRFEMFDLTTNLATALDRINEFGYIEIDNQYRYVKANGVVKKLFPEIEANWKIDKSIPVADSPIYKQVLGWALDPNCKEKSRRIPLNDRYYDVSVRDIIYGRAKKVGWLIEFVDRTDEYRYTETIKNYNKNLNEEVTRKTAALRYARDRLVIGMAEMAENRDASTGDHIKRTSASVDIFSHYMLTNDNPYELSESFLKMVARGAPMHDLGKVAVHDSILKKPGRLTDEEYAEMKKHSEAGAEIVENILRGADDDEFVTIAENIARYHHEKWDGTGYPTGIKGEEIPIEARIMALVDVFDALVSKRCYKAAYSYDKAFSIIEEGLGTQFDPTLGKAFIDCRPALERLYDSYSANE